MPTKFIAHALVILMLMLSHTSPALGADGVFFTGHNADLPRIETARKQALAEQKLLLVALGADWCHDSRALADTFMQPQLATQLANDFVVKLVDVGYLQDGYNIAAAFGEPVYWGTPSVMIIDPATKQVLNKADLSTWTNAASYDLSEYQNYFQAANFTHPPVSISATHQAQIDDFEQQQATRVRAGYQIVAPLLRAFKESDADKPSAEFMTYWTELSKLRQAAPQAITELYQEAKKQSDTEVPLTLPQLPSLSWEPSNSEAY